MFLLLFVFAACMNCFARPVVVAAVLNDFGMKKSRISVCFNFFRSVFLIFTKRCDLKRKRFLALHFRGLRFCCCYCCIMRTLRLVRGDDIAVIVSDFLFFNSCTNFFHFVLS